MHQINISIHEIFQALSDPFRIRIVHLMIHVGELCLCELSESMDEPEYKLSRHMKVLKNAGIITSERDGKWIYHSLVIDQSFLNSIYAGIIEFPNSEKQSKEDLKSFNKRKLLRDNGRCRQITFNEVFKEKYIALK